MKLLIKFPSRGRTEQFLNVLFKYVSKAKDTSNISFLITADSDDLEMVNAQNQIEELLKNIDHQIIHGESKNKIHAINRDMEKAPRYDILLLASDDMHPVFDGYDEVIRLRMQETFPDLDGVLWFNDGHAEDRLNTLVCMGRVYYERFNYIYNPIYKSFFCDNEFTDVANRLKKQKYFPECIIEHKHPAWDSCVPEDESYKKNATYWDEDERTYLHTKVYDYDLSILICSLVERHYMLKRLLDELALFKTFSSLKIEILTDVDNRQKSIGQKRNDLVARAKGKYCCFIDDDDQVAKYYFREIEEALKDNPDCVALLGMFYINGNPIKPFVHSIDAQCYMEDEEAFYRPPNHLNPILTGLVKRVGFAAKNFGEDTDFALRMVGTLKTQGLVRNLIYHYYYKTR